MAGKKTIAASPFGDKEFLPDAVLAELDEITKPKLESVADTELPDLDVDEFRENPIVGDEDTIRDWIDKYKVSVEEDEPEEEEEGEEEEEEDFEEGTSATDDTAENDSPDGIVDKLVNDKDYGWKIFTAVRGFLYELAYDYTVEKPNKIAILEKARTKLIRKYEKTPQEQKTLEGIDKFLQECQAIRKDYFKKIALHELQEDLGKDMINIELRRLHKKGLLSKYVVYAMVFGLPTFINGKALLTAKREVKESKQMVNAT